MNPFGLAWRWLCALAAGEPPAPPRRPPGVTVPQGVVDRAVAALAVPPPAPAPEPPVAAPIPGPRRREPHPHVTSVAHAGYCLIIDACKAFIRERLYEPTVVYLDKAAELILRQHAVEQTWLPADGDVRAYVDTLLGCRVVWDAPSFRFGAAEDPGLRAGPPPVPHGKKVPPVANDPHSVPVTRGKAVRPVDAVDFGHGGARPVNPAGVPAGRSISPETAALIRASVTAAAARGTAEFAPPRPHTPPEKP